MSHARKAGMQVENSGFMQFKIELSGSTFKGAIYIPRATVFDKITDYKLLSK
jgi:hypothetical protein